jgi:hypothetical protein
MLILMELSPFVAVMRLTGSERVTKQDHEIICTLLFPHDMDDFIEVAADEIRKVLKER